MTYSVPLRRLLAAAGVCYVAFSTLFSALLLALSLQPGFGGVGTATLLVGLLLSAAGAVLAVARTGSGTLLRVVGWTLLAQLGLLAAATVLGDAYPGVRSAYAVAGVVAPAFGLLASRAARAAGLRSPVAVDWR